MFAGASVEAVEAVSAELDDVAGVQLDALEGLGSLLDKSLIRQVDATDDDQTARVVMLETIRAFAIGAARGRAAIRRRGPRAACPVLRPRWRSNSQRAAGDATPDLSPSDLDNLRIAWRHWVAQGDLDRLAELKDAVWPLYEGRGWYHATVELLRDLLGVLTATPETPERWEQELTLRMSLARALTLLRGYTGEVEDAYAEALALSPRPSRRAADLPRPPEPGEPVRISGRDGQGHRRRERDPPPRRRPGRPEHARGGRVPPRVEHRILGRSRSRTPASRRTRSWRSRAAATGPGDCASAWTSGCRA